MKWKNFIDEVEKGFPSAQHVPDLHIDTPSSGGADCGFRIRFTYHTSLRVTCEYLTTNPTSPWCVTLTTPEGHSESARKLTFMDAQDECVEKMRARTVRMATVAHDVSEALKKVHT